MDISILCSNTGRIFAVKRLLSVRHTFTPANKQIWSMSPTGGHVEDLISIIILV